MRPSGRNPAGSARFPLLASALAVAGLAAACGGANPAPNTSMSDEGEEESEEANAAGEVVRRFDLNRDKQPDVFKYYRPKAGGGDMLVRKEMDLNFDGKIDYIYLYDEAGEVTMIKSDHDFDGKTDIVDYYQQKVLVRREVDLNFDGQPDLWKFYERGKLARKERDTNSDTKVDYWEYYDGDQIDRIGLDTDGDGNVDIWEKRKQAASE
jgi:hypothetical protein